MHLGVALRCLVDDHHRLAALPQADVAHGMEAIHKLDVSGQLLACRWLLHARRALDPQQRRSEHGRRQALAIRLKSPGPSIRMIFSAHANPPHLLFVFVADGRSH